MPIYKKCCICGRLCDIPPKSAEPYYKGGYACNGCYATRVVPAKKQEEEKKRRKSR